MIKSAIKYLVNVINKAVIVLGTTTKLDGSFAYLVSISASSSSEVKLSGYSLFKSRISIDGNENKINSHNALIEDSNINIKGTNNQVIIHEGVKLRKAIIHLRGENCRIEIQKNTTFGQVRIINVGINNDIIIGSGCLFSDNIEIWASDTHTIYDSDGKIMNQEKPIIIGNNVWVGAFSKILKGVTVHEGTVIGLNSLVTRDLEPNSVYAGNPVKKIKSNITWALEYREKIESYTHI